MTYVYRVKRYAKLTGVSGLAVTILYFHYEERRSSFTHFLTYSVRFPLSTSNPVSSPCLNTLHADLRQP